jgi:hypothetical protein
LPDDGGDAVTRLMASWWRLARLGGRAGSPARIDAVFLPRPCHGPGPAAQCNWQLPREALVQLAAACAAPSPPG